VCGIQELLETFDPSAVTVLEHPGAHFVPTCSGDYKQQLAAFLDRFKLEGSTAAAAGQQGTSKASASVGSNLGSLAEDEPENETAEGAGLSETAAVGKL
jgi:hypothetical protein